MADPTSATIARLNKLGFPSSPETYGNISGDTSKFVQEELATGNAGGFNTGIAPNQRAGFFQLVSWAEQFGAATGWTHMPSEDMIMLYLNNGWSNATQTEFFTDIATRMGLGSQQWLTVGMNKNDYIKATDTINAELFNLTGSSDSYGILGFPAVQKFAVEGTSGLSSYIQQNAALNQKYGYIKHGYTYNTFQDYKATNHQQLTGRYGVGYTDTNAVNALDNPEAQFNASGGAFSYPTSLTPQQTSQRVTGSQSSVR